MFRRSVFAIPLIATWTSWLSAQPPAELPPGASGTIAFVCIDQSTGQPASGVHMTFATNKVDNTGSHFHPTSPNHPAYGMVLNPSNGNTTYMSAYGVPAVEVRVTATRISETARVTARCQNQAPGAPDAVRDIIVGLNGIYYVSEHGVWTFIGATSAHGSTAYNHWMQTQPAYNILAATQDYLNMFPDTPGRVLASNDMSLAYGGKFDICSTWDSPHQFHDQGTAADIRGNAAPNAIPVSRQEQFKTFCQLHGGTFNIIENACPKDSDGNVQKTNRHIHCQFGGPSSPFDPNLVCPGQVIEPCQ